MAENQLIELLCRLIAVPSVNPEHTDDTDIAGEERMAVCLAALLEERGFTIQWDARDSGRPNVVGVLGPERPRRTIMLESHLDTVGVQGMTGPTFAARIENGRLYGRGACDTKGPMAAALHALEPELLARLAAAGCRILYVGAMGEEKGNHGALRLVETGLRADEAIILEPTELRIVHAHKGALWLIIEVFGTAAHGSNPHLGLNAIVGMMEVIALLQREMELERQALVHELLGEPSLNIGLIRGGTAVNIVPDSCRIEVDCRMLPGREHEHFLARLRHGLAALQQADRIRGYRIELMKNGPPFYTDAGSALVARRRAGWRRAGRPALTDGAAWYSDAGPFSQVCPDVAVFGPGSIRQAHTADEYIELDSLQAGCDILRQFFRLLAEELELDERAG